MQLLIRDETTSGSITNELTLDVLTESITVRELIRSRVYQEVDDHNRRVREANSHAQPYSGLVTPTRVEVQLNTHRAGKTLAKEVDWKQQFESACTAFERNGFFILVDDYQTESLDDTIALKPDTRVSFVKLTQLVGG